MLSINFIFSKGIQIIKIVRKSLKIQKDKNQRAKRLKNQ
jgi:hypothetical protein